MPEPEAQRSLLGNAVVQPAVAALRQQLAELHAPVSELADEERKIVTILFADVSGFTALSEKLDREEVRNLVNACFERFVPIVKKFEGTVDKFMGGRNHGAVRRAGRDACKKNDLHLKKVADLATDIGYL